MRNTRGIDILVTDENAKRSVTIQCKSNQDGSSSLDTEQEAEDFISLNHFYVFVAMGSPEERPRFHVVPARSVVCAIKTDFRQFLMRGGKDNPIRKFNDPDWKYVDRWDLLKLH